ncbi:hypothetical protein B0F90DRAFT_1867205 [Multifurca ochricompacta]|uniref:Uncharacterized protein n=1 Tax=Multifurca ochricompacta TaxID=376703 RepID=A0AAD4QJJ6_9AGAM|nr:hypothetical protein B0F90DRAFT_1867205 [Multifurca ochricompacta]
MSACPPTDWMPIWGGSSKIETLIMIPFARIFWIFGEKGYARKVRNPVQEMGLPSVPRRRSQHELWNRPGRLQSTKLWRYHHATIAYGVAATGYPGQLLAYAFASIVHFPFDRERYAQGLMECISTGGLDIQVEAHHVIADKLIRIFLGRSGISS